MMFSANRSNRSAKTSQARGKRSPWRSFTPRLELLEDRTLPSTVNWINPAGGDWDTAGNWQDSLGVNRLPGAADDVVISQSGITVSHAAGVTDSVNSLTSQAAISITGGTLVITDQKPDRLVKISYLPNQLTGTASISFAAVPGVWSSFVINATNPNAPCSCM